MSEYNSYPQKTPLNWQRIWEKFFYWFGILLGVALLVGLIGGFVFMGLHFKTSFDEKDQWRYECRAAGNTVVDPNGGDPELCMSNVTYTDPRDENWGSFDKIQCVKDGGIVGKYENDFLCVHGKIESREP